MICLDTNILIGVLNERPLSVVRQFNERIRSRELATSILCVFELEYGVAKSNRAVKSAERLRALLRTPLVILDFNRADAAEAADIRAALESNGTPIGPYDVLIAAQARRRGATLVTANTREFARVPDLALANWSAPDL